MSDLYLLAWLDDTRVAMPAVDIVSIIDIETITPVPRAPPHIVGLTAVRSQPMTVIDTRKVIGLVEPAPVADARAAVFDVAGHRYALLFDGIVDVVDCQGGISDAPAGLSPQWQNITVGCVEADGAPALLIDPRVIAQGETLLSD